MSDKAIVMAILGTTMHPKRDWEYISAEADKVIALSAPKSEATKAFKPKATEETR